MTLTEIKTCLGLTRLSIFQARDAEGNAKTNKNGQPIFKFLGYVGNEKTLNGYVSQNAVKSLKQDINAAVELSSFEGNDGPVPMITSSNAIVSV